MKTLSLSLSLYFFSPPRTSFSAASSPPFLPTNYPNGVFLSNRRPPPPFAAAAAAAMYFFFSAQSQPPTVACKMEALSECAHVAYTYLHVLALICMLSRCLLTKFLHRSSVGSLLRVCCWLGCVCVGVWSAGGKHRTVMMCSSSTCFVH